MSGPCEPVNKPITVSQVSIRLNWNSEARILVNISVLREEVEEAGEEGAGVVAEVEAGVVAEVVAEAGAAEVV